MTASHAVYPRHPMEAILHSEEILHREGTNVSKDRVTASSGCPSAASCTRLRLVETEVPPQRYPQLRRASLSVRGCGSSLLRFVASNGRREPISIPIPFGDCIRLCNLHHPIVERFHIEKRLHGLVRTLACTMRLARRRNKQDQRHRRAESGWFPLVQCQ